MSGWKFNKSPYTWYGVSCNLGRVTQLDLNQPLLCTLLRTTAFSRDSTNTTSLPSSTSPPPPAASSPPLTSLSPCTSHRRTTVRGGGYWQQRLHADGSSHCGPNSTTPLRLLPRASPSTQLSWSGVTSVSGVTAAAAADGSEESSQLPLNRSPDALLDSVPIVAITGPVSPILHSSRLSFLDPSTHQFRRPVQRRHHHPATCLLHVQLRRQDPRHTLFSFSFSSSDRLS
ncbi:unnamed protein product [Camellia sinensis]